MKTHLLSKTVVQRSLFTAFLSFLLSFTASGQKMEWAVETEDIQLFDMAADKEGNLFVLSLEDFIYPSCYIKKFDKNGTLLWGRSLRNYYSTGKALTVDEQGNVYATGQFYDRFTYEFFVFMVKYSASGEELWTKYLKTLNGYGTDIAYDPSGYIYATGHFRDALYLTNPTAQDTVISLLSSPDEMAGYVMKLSPDGTYVWAKSTGISFLNDENSSLALHNGGVVMAGMFDYYDLSPTNLRVIKKDASCTTLWEKMFENSNVQAPFIVTDKEGSIYVGGSFKGTISLGSNDVPWNISASEWWADSYLIKFDSLGRAVWAKKFEGTDDIEVQSLTIDSEGSLYAGGNFLGTADFDPNEGEALLTGDSMTNGSPFMVKMDSEGNYVWAKTFNKGRQFSYISYETSGITPLVVDANDYLYFGGRFDSTDVDPSTGVVRVSGKNVVKWNLCLDNSCLVTSTDDEKKQQRFLVLPNPTKGEVAIQWSGSDQIVQLDVFDVQGGAAPYTRSTAMNSFTLDGPSGIYLVRAQTKDGKTALLKVLKE